jgi:tRNA dimethylallyltransferase
MMKKLLVICGPTATGKTALALNLAKKFNGELVSADSRQVYKGMDIGTGKDLPKNSQFQIPHSQQLLNSQFPIGYFLLEKIPLWLYDIVEPDYQFSVADYVECATLVIKDIWQRDKLPILVGGTGFYLKALIDGLETIGVPPDWELRQKLAAYSVFRLSALLKKIDPQKWEKMNESDRRNSRRLIRAIEISTKLKIKNEKLKMTMKKLKIKKLLFIGLKAPFFELYSRIDQRVEERLRQGIIKEIETLLKKGYNWENSALGTTMGYKQWQPYFKNSQSAISNSQLREEIKQRWKFDEHDYARRQMTWFRKDSRIRWFKITEEGWQDKVEQLVRSWYNR